MEKVINRNHSFELKLNNGMNMPRLGMGTWFLGENRKAQAAETEALRAGIDAGIRLIDTAEMYGSGKAERLIGRAIQGYDRSQLFLVSKVYPYNAGRKHIFHSLDQTLKNLGTDYLDMYLLHWRGAIPLEETVSCMEQLVGEGKIRSWGVSNFDTEDMEELFEIPAGKNCAVNQVLYHLGSRGVEYDLLPWLEEHHVPLMAYCPLAQAGDLRRGLLEHSAVRQAARNHGVSEMQILLAFVLHRKNVIAIPRSGKKEHVLQNQEVWKIVLSEEEYAALDAAFPAPCHKTALDIV
ncbi:MAG: aldo/keto reductase [Lachnospiraceae bacterium]|nr:aldo/keto reductase [Lachnospiraceae bacterium]